MTTGQHGSDAVDERCRKPDDGWHDAEQHERGKKAQPERADGKHTGPPGCLGRPASRLQARISRDAADGGRDRGPSLTGARQGPRRRRANLATSSQRRPSFDGGRTDGERGGHLAESAPARTRRGLGDCPHRGGERRAAGQAGGEEVKRQREVVGQLRSLLPGQSRLKAPQHSRTTHADCQPEHQAGRGRHQQCKRQTRHGAGQLGTPVGSRSGRLRGSVRHRPGETRMGGRSVDQERGCQPEQDSAAEHSTARHVEMPLTRRRRSRPATGSPGATGGFDKSAGPPQTEQVEPESGCQDGQSERRVQQHLNRVSTQPSGEPDPGDRQDRQ